MILETGKDIMKNEDWDVTGPIARIELTNYGSGYTLGDLPNVTVASMAGSNAELTVAGIQGTGATITIDVVNNIAGIGSIRAVEITNFGVDYSNATANAVSSGDGNANLEPIISGLGIKDGTWVNDDGKIDYKIIQDSFYYQDFSYVVRSGLVYNAYKDVLKSVIHPAGLQAFGEIVISQEVSLTPTILSTIEILRDIKELIVFLQNEFALDTTAHREIIAKQSLS